ncbi:MAG: hypothetical protein EOP48_34190, partial [Sphingobacteriales bacterium]
MANLIQEVEGQSILGSHLLATADEAIMELLKEFKVDDNFSVMEEYDEVINSFAALPLSYKQRAVFIGIVSNNLRKEDLTGKRLNLLVDEAGAVIDGKMDIYTPPTNDNQLLVPGFANIKFIHSELFENIISLSKPEHYEKRGKARFVYDQLNKYCNIHSFEPTTLAEKIIRTTNELLGNDNTPKGDAISAIQEMNRCLYHNHVLQSDRSSITIENIPAIAQDGSIRKMKDLHLSVAYPKGKNVALLFEDIYEQYQYIAPPTDLGFDGSISVQNIQTFLTWLGINEFFKFSSKIEKESFPYGNSLLHHPFLTFFFF